jgi:hypothetical protein
MNVFILMLFYATVFHVNGIWSSSKSTVCMSEQCFLGAPGFQWGVRITLAVHSAFEKSLTFSKLNV